MMMRRTCLVVLALLVSVSATAQTQDDFFNPEVLQRIELWLNGQDWAKLKAAFQENTYYPADMTWNGITVHNVGIRSRGLGSRSSTKPGLRVDFDRYNNGQQFLGLKSFVLDNLTQDHTGIKETAAMRFFTRIGIPRAARNAHAPLCQRRLHGALRPGRIRRQDDDGPRLRQHRRQRAERRLPVRIQLRARQPVAIHLRRIGAGAVQGALRHQDQRDPRRVARSGDRSKSWCGWSTTQRRRCSSRRLGPGWTCPAFVRYIAGAEFHRPERRLQRLRRDEQFLFLPAREQPRATSSSPGTRTTRSCSRISASRRVSMRTS